MDIKTLSTIFVHVSSKTTLDIYLHSTEEMKKKRLKRLTPDSKEMKAEIAAQKVKLKNEQ